MVEIIEHTGNHQLLLQEKGNAATTVEVEKRTKKLQVLLVDDNVVCLAVMSSQLKHCGFQVTPIREAVEALDLLRRNKNSIDIVLTDVIRFDLNGFHLMEIISRQFKVPVIIISAIDDERIIEEGKRCGARDYLVKPVQLKVLQTVCEQAIKKVPNNPANALTLGPHYFAEMNENPTTKLSCDDNDGDDHDDNDDDDDGDDDDEKKNKNKKKKKKKKEGYISSSNGESSPNRKKPRVIWDARLHHKFVEAVLRLDMEKAVPKKILEIMNEPNLTRENIASHLQKFRNVVRREREKFCQELVKNPREAMQHFLNSTVQAASPTSGLSINHHHYNNSFSSGQEMILCNNANFTQQRSLYSDGNNQQQQLMTITNNNSLVPKTVEARMQMSAVMEYPTIDHKIQNAIFGKEFSLQQQVVVSPQLATVPYQEASSSSSSIGNNYGVHHQTANVQPFHDAIVGGGGAGNNSDKVKEGHLSSSIDQARPIVELQPSSQFASDYSIEGNNINGYLMLPSTINSNIVPYQASPSQPSTSLEESIDNFIVPNQTIFSQSTDSIEGFIDNSIVPYQAIPFQPIDSIGGFIDSSLVLYQGMSSQTTDSIGGFIDSSMFPYQAIPSKPSDSVVGLIDNSIVPYQAMPSLPTNNIGEFIDSSMIPYQVVPPQPTDSIGGFIDNSIVSYPAMHSQPIDNIGEFNGNSIVPYQAMSTQKPSQPTDSIGAFIDNSFVPHQTMPTQQLPQPSASIEVSIDNSIAPYQAMPTSQPCDSIGGSLNNPIVPYQAWPTQSNMSLEESIVNDQAWPTQELSQSSGHIGGSIDNSVVPYQAWHTHNPSYLSDSFGENNDHLIQSINSMVPYQVDHTTQPSQAISTFEGNHSSFPSLFLSHDEKNYFSEDKHDCCMEVLPTNITNVVQGNNTNAALVHDTYVGENISGYDNHMLNPLVADDNVPEAFSINGNDIYDPPDEEITSMINELLNCDTSPSNR